MEGQKPNTAERGYRHYGFNGSNPVKHFTPEFLQLTKVERHQILNSVTMNGIVDLIEKRAMALQDLLLTCDEIRLKYIQGKFEGLQDVLNIIKGLKSKEE